MANFLALTAAGNSVICGLVKFWKLSLALAAACFAGEFWQTTAQETLTVEYTLEGVRHELQVDADEEVLEFENIPLTSLTLPEGLTRLRELTVNSGSLTNLSLPNEVVDLRNLAISDNRLTALKLPEDLARDVGSVYLGAFGGALEQFVCALQDEEVCSWQRDDR